jgi:hypothetical protein
MTEDRQSRIRDRAYEIWEQCGQSGDPEDHWFAAERELDAVPAGGQPEPTSTASDAAAKVGEDKRSLASILTDANQRGE